MEKDLTLDSPVSWYLPLATCVFSITSFRLTSYVLFVAILIMRSWNRVIDPSMDNFVLEGNDIDNPIYLN